MIIIAKVSVSEAKVRGNRLKMIGATTCVLGCTGTKSEGRCSDFAVQKVWQVFEGVDMCR